MNREINLNPGTTVLTTMGCLQKGVIKSREHDGMYYMVEYPDLDANLEVCTETQPMIPANIHLTPEDAQLACEELASYWDNQRRAIQEGKIKL